MAILKDQSCEVLSCGESNLKDMKRIIELSGRTCYKSLDKINDESAEKFVNQMIRSNHLAMCEHGTIYLSIPILSVKDEQFIVNHYQKNKYSVVRIYDGNNIAYVTTNYRVIIENKWESDLKYMTEYVPQCHEKRITMKLVTNLQVSHEYVRHRCMSFAQESSRYCNYSKGKFDNQLTFIRPNFGKYQDNNFYLKWLEVIDNCEKTYLLLADLGCNAQECAQVLNKAVKTELIMSGTISDWMKFFDLRYYQLTGKAHPQAFELAKKIYDKFTNELGIADI